LADIAEVLSLRIGSGAAVAAPTSLVTQYGTNAHKSKPYGQDLKRSECPSPVLFTEACGHGELRPWLRPCDKWTCIPCCSWRVETEIKPEIVRGIEWARRKGQTLKFYTFTWKAEDEAAATNKSAAQRRRKDVAHFVQQIRRENGRDSFEYLRVTENHKSGRVHLHMLVVAPFLLQAELSQQWENNTRGAHRVYVEAVGMKCPNCWPGKKATQAEKRKHMIIPPPGKGKCESCGLEPAHDGFTDQDVAKAAAKELGKYLSKSVPVSYLSSKGRRQPIARSKGWLRECKPDQSAQESEPPCNSCHVTHTYRAVWKNEFLAEHLLAAAIAGEILNHTSLCACWPVAPG